MGEILNQETERLQEILKSSFTKIADTYGRDENEKEAIKRLFEIVPLDMGFELISFVETQLNEIARLGNINTFQMQQMEYSAEMGAFIIIYYKFYNSVIEKDPSKTVLSGDPIFFAFRNLIRLLFSRVSGGGDRQLALAKINAEAQKVTYMQR